jgi:hypothetical protein
MAHAVFDSASLARQAKQKLLEAERQRHKDIVLSTLTEGRIIRENDYDSYEKQAGYRFITSVFEDRLRKLVPTLTFKLKPMPEFMAREMSLPIDQKMRSVWYPTPAGGELYCGAYLYPIVQEFDLIIAKKIVVPVIDPATGFLERKIEDIPDPTKYDMSEAVFEGEGLALTSGEQWTYAPDNRIPGWRSVLLWLIQRGLATPTQVEREFLTADRASWATKMGRQAHDEVL